MQATMLKISKEHILAIKIISTFWYIKFKDIYSKYVVQMDYIIKTFN